MKKALAVAGLLLLVGCSPGSTSTSEGPGDEATSETSPAQENATPPNGGEEGEDGGGGDNQQVSVDLPGLPIGGSGAVFSSDAPTQCVDVNWTGPALPNGVELAFTTFEVPPEFTVDSSPCSEAPCVGGSYRITAETGGCTVSVTWNGESVDAEPPSVLRADAEAFCTSQTACAEVKAAADDVNEQTGGQSAINLTINATPDGSSEGSSPTAASSGG